MSSPTYRVLLSFDAERKVFTARAPELDHCSAEGASRAEAIAHLEEEIQAQVQNMLASGSNPPPVSVDEEQYSGELQVKVSRQLHRDLAWQARMEGIDINQLTAELLAGAIESRRGARPQRGNRAAAEHQGSDNIGNMAGDRPRGRGYGRQGYNQGILEDRANFIEYVRNLEHGAHNAGGHQPYPRGGGGGGGRRNNANNNRNRDNRGRGPGNGSPQGGGNPNGGNKPL